MFSFSYSPGYAPASAFSTSGSVAVSTVSNGTYQYDTGNLEAGTFGFTINWDTYTVTVHIGEFYMYPAYPALPGAQGGQMSSFVVPIGSSNMLFNGDYDNSVTLTVTL
jgi:hypothetical protein